MRRKMYTYLSANETVATASWRHVGERQVSR